MQEECFGCRTDKSAGHGRLIDGRFVYRSDRWTVNHRLADDGELSDEFGGWFVAQPRQHVQGFDELDTTQAKEFAVLSINLTEAMHQAFGEEYRIYIASLGVADTHLHFHFVPLKSQYGLDALSSYSAVSSAADAVAAVGGHLAPRPQAPSKSEAGLARVVERAIAAVRSRSPYNLAKEWLRALPGGRYAAAEIYTLIWLAVMLTGIGVGANGPKVASVAIAVLGVIRLLDIASTQTAILLYESRSDGFIGVQSIARSVLLALINLAEVALITASWTVAMARWSGAAYEAVDALGFSSVLDALQPLGGQGMTPLSGGAKLLDIVQISIMFYVTVVLLGGVLGNIGARLSGDPEP